MENDSPDAKRAAKLAAAIQELTLQNENKDRQAADLLVANKNLEKAEEKIKKVNHLYAFISQVNQKIVRVKDEATLFRNACNIALGFGKFKMAWIGIFDDTQKKIVVVEKCGIPEEEIRLLTDTPWQGNGPQDYVLRTGAYYICNDVENDPEVETWRPFAARHGIRSCMVLPVKKSGIIIGTLNLYSTELDFAGEEEIKLLAEVTGDISFALGLFEKEKQQKASEEEIKAGEILYHSLFENMLEGFAHCKIIYENGVPQDFIYLDVNGAFVKLTGLKNMTGKKETEMLPGVSKENPELLERYNRVSVTGKPERFEVYIESRKMWFDISLYSTEKGYFTAIFDVITEKKAAEEKLANSEKHFRALIEHGSDMKSLTDKDGKVLYGSPSIKKGLGYTSEEFLHKYPNQLIHPDDIEGYLENRNKLLQTPGNSFSFRQRRLHKNGTWIWCEGTITNLLHEPAVGALVTNFQDVSERIKSNQQLEFNQNNLSALINNTNDLMWSVDKDFKLITCNHAFDKLMTLISGKPVPPGGNLMIKEFGDEALVHFKKQYNKAFSGETFSEVEHTTIPTDIWTQVSYYPIRSGTEVVGTACHSHNITAIKKAEIDILQSEGRLKEAQALAHVSNWEIDLLTGVHTWSDEFYTIMGIKHGDVKPSLEGFLSFIHPSEKARVQQLIAESFQTFKDSFFYSRVITKQGNTKHVFSEYRFEFDNAKKPIRLYGILQDVTERKEAEEKIKQNEIRFREFFDSAPESIVVIDVNTMTFPKFNNNALKLLKYSPEELIKIGPVQVSPPFQPDGRATEEKAKELITEAMKGGRPVFEWLLLDGNGKEIISEVRLAALTDTDGPQVIANFADITDRKKTEQELQIAHDRLLFHIENSPLGFIEWDNQVRVRSMSKRAEEILGWSENEFINTNKNGPSIVYIDDRPLIIKLNQQLLSGEVERNSVQHRNYTKDGRVIWCEWFNSAMKDKDGKVDTILSLVQDITKRKEAEENILELNEHLEKRVDERTNELLEANKSLEAFSYSVSHDLRSPVRSVMGFAKIISRDYGADMDEKAKELFHHIEESGRRMNAIINDLLNFAKWGKEKLQLEEVDMTALFAHVWKNTLLESPHHAVLELQPLPKVLADKAMIRQVVINLISNAIKYSSKKEKPVVKVGFEETKDEVIFHVTDNGAGFDMANYGRLFGAFQRLHGVNDFEGTGIGLTIIKTIIEKHKGRVWAEGKLDEGATFWFSLPKSAFVV